MDFTIVGLNILYAIVGLVLMYIAFRVFDKLMPRLDFEEELKKGNIAVAIFTASIFISLSLIISNSLN